MSTLALIWSNSSKGGMMRVWPQSRSVANWFTHRLVYQSAAQVGPLSNSQRVHGKAPVPNARGIPRCVELNRIDLTLEATLWDNPHFIALFVDTPEVITRAIQRLVNIEYIVPTTQP